MKDTLAYDLLLDHLNPKNTFCGRSMDIAKMPYANVKYCIRLLPKVNSWESVRQLFEISFDVTEGEFWRAP